MINSYKFKYVFKNDQIKLSRLRRGKLSNCIEIERKKKIIQANKGGLTDCIIELYKQIKAKSARVERESYEMANLFENCVKRNKAECRAVFLESLDLYRDCLRKYEY